VLSFAFVAALLLVFMAVAFFMVAATRCAAWWHRAERTYTGR